MQAEHIDAFLGSAFAVLSEQAQARPDRGSPLLRSGAIRSFRELTALVMIEGDLHGMVLYSMSLATADKLRTLWRPSGRGTGEQSAHEVVWQTAEMIAAGGVTKLSELGYTCQPAQSLVISGFGEPLTTATTVLVVPVYTRYGDMDIGVAVHPQDSVKDRFALIAGRGAGPSGSGDLRPTEAPEPTETLDIADRSEVSAA